MDTAEDELEDAAERDAKRPPRAQPLSPDDRRAMIVDAVIPLLVEHGRGVTSKQIAEAAGIAEGTIFRAFGDKETLVQAAIEKYLDPEPLRNALRAIDPSLPFEHKIRAILYLLRERFESVMRIMAVVGPQRPPVPQERGEFARIIAQVLEPEAEQLNWPPERVAHLLRLISFSSAFPMLNEGIEFSIDDLARFTMVGVAGRPIDFDAQSADLGPATASASPSAR
ncbi:TetR/AcrR family transcriptional regulator [Leifsonia sp. Le1]|uniref:TetR/AcrR family transcriptional regulator n=1 Tax=Leifsonia sp. Le1 TaxID=3404918 RepID=UPI003EB92931